MPFVQVKDIKMHYQIFKSQYATDTLVLVHGVGLSMELWEPILPYFLHNYHVVIFDLRGHGETERGTSDFSWELFVDDIDSLMNLLQSESFHLIGHGLGATLTMKYSQKYKEKVKSIILLAVPAFFPRKSIDALIENRKVLSHSGSMLPLAQNMAKGITMEPSDSSIFQKIVNAYSKVTPESYFQIFDLYLDTPPNGDFEFITHPTLSLVGVHDPIYLTSYTLSSKLLMQTRLLVVPHSSNAVFIDQPKLSAEWIHDFIQNPILVRSNYGSFESTGAEIERVRGNLQSSIYFYNVALKYHPEDEWLYDETITLYEQLKNGVEQQKGKRIKKEQTGRS